MKDLRLVLALPFLLLGMFPFGIGGLVLMGAGWMLSWDTYGFLNLLTDDSWYVKALIPLRWVVGWILLVIGWPIFQFGFWLMVFAEKIKGNQTK